MLSGASSIQILFGSVAQPNLFSLSIALITRAAKLTAPPNTSFSSTCIGPIVNASANLHLLVTGTHLQAIA